MLAEPPKGRVDHLSGRPLGLEPGRSVRIAWDAVAVIIWTVHVAVAPIGVLWSLVVATLLTWSGRSRTSAGSG